MYVGHAAIALVLKSRAPAVPIVPLTIACFGPDWLELLLMIPHARPGMALYTHSVQAVVIGAALAGAVFAASGRKGARVIVLAWLLHWPCDLLTGLKPVFGLSSLIGLDLYHLPLADFALESVIVMIGCRMYAARFARAPATRRPLLALGAALIVLQAAVDVALAAIRTADWSPSLALARWQPHVVRSTDAVTEPRTACILHLCPGTDTARVRWRRTDHGAS